MDEQKAKGIVKLNGSLQPIEPKAEDMPAQVTFRSVLRGKYPDGTEWERDVTPDDEEYYYGG